jgi:hypothetical protein
MISESVIKSTAVYTRVKIEKINNLFPVDIDRRVYKVACVQTLLSTKFVLLCTEAEGWGW